MSAEQGNVFKYGEFERVFKSTDYVQMEALEDALEQLTADTQAAVRETRESAKIKGMVLALAQVFENVFGEGSANKVLGASTDLNDAIDALMALIEHAHAQDAKAATRWKEIAGKYAPNREQRRARKT